MLRCAEPIACLGQWTVFRKIRVFLTLCDRQVFDIKGQTWQERRL